MKQYKVLTGQSELFFDTLDDAKTCAEFIQGVVVDDETGERIADYYNIETEQGVNA